MITEDHVNVHVETLVNKHTVHTHKHTFNLSPKKDIHAANLLETDMRHSHIHKVLHDKLSQNPLHS